jgi:metal-dependent HD superfamily phosphatase/phosphodiesterase
MLTLEEIKKNKQVQIYVTRANEQLGVIGWTEHGTRHSDRVAEGARMILGRLTDSSDEAELAAIAGYMHDIGNVVNRQNHAQTGALIAGKILSDMDVNPEVVCEIMSAIGNHDEGTGEPVSNIAAAVILADKADVHRSRVRSPALVKFDIHDRVNYAVTSSKLTVEGKNGLISLDLTVDTKISPVMEYFEIFLSRMIISRKAADFLGCKFELTINGTKLM